MKKLPVFVLVFLGFVTQSFAQDSLALKTEKIPGEGVWLDPAIAKFPRDRFRVTAWFEDQFLGDGEGYLRRSREFTGVGRIELRRQVRDTLKTLSNESQATVNERLTALVEAGKISNLEFHWIVNGFTCHINRDHIDDLQLVPGVRMIYFAGPISNVGNTVSSDQPKQQTSVSSTEFTPDRFESPWYIRSLKADQVWKQHKITGKGILNVVHDMNFVLSPNIVVNRYRNPKEEPNGKDDSGNGLIDDLHGYDFQRDRSVLTRIPMPKTGNASSRTLHGHQCVAIICGRGTEQSPNQFGVAPESQWAGVMASQQIEAAVEWAIEAGADTYSMSFSRPDLGQYRSHWRKIMEHGAFCGVHFVSGAGNFATKGTPKYAPVPIQMRVPEDIPNVVFAAAGVHRDLSRTSFSSQGPVQWDTAHYHDGLVDKPEVAAFNFQIPLLVPSGGVIDKGVNGNSFAGPMYCGTIALVLSANPELNPWEVRQIIIDTATDIGPEGYDHQTGHGLINAFAAVSEALDRQRK